MGLEQTGTAAGNDQVQIGRERGDVRVRAEVHNLDEKLGLKRAHWQRATRG